jgi:hypothetical protein
MSNLKLPVNFEEKAKLPPAANGTGYPYRISASDLMKNFTYAALDAHEDWIEDVGVSQYPGRKLKLPQLPGGDEPQSLTVVGSEISWKPAIPDPPTSGTHVLGCVDGEIQWIETESC